MLNQKPALKVSIYVNEGESHRGVPVSSAILNFLFYRGVAGATVTKSSAGFGADHRLHSSSFVDISDHLPVIIQFIDPREKVDALMEKLQELVGHGTMEIQETIIIQPAGHPSIAQKTPIRMEKSVCMMTIYIGESDRWNGQPLHEALVDAMRSNDISGVTVTRGILGYGVKKEIHKERAFHLSADLPIVLSVVDTGEKIQQLMPLMDQMIEQGLVVFSDAEIVSYAHRAPAAGQ
jgi:PII-like signaling protein